MSTSYPTGLDAFTTWVDNTDDVDAAIVNNVQDAIEALQAKVGIDASADVTSHDKKIDVAEADIDALESIAGTLPALATNSLKRVRVNVGETAFEYVDDSMTAGSVAGGTETKNQGDGVGTYTIDYAVGISECEYFEWYFKLNCQIPISTNRYSNGTYLMKGKVNGSISYIFKKLESNTSNTIQTLAMNGSGGLITLPVLTCTRSNTITLTIDSITANSTNIRVTYTISTPGTEPTSWNTTITNSYIIAYKYNA